jgi:GAF domain-containing protein
LIAGEFSPDWAVSFAKIDRQLISCSTVADVYEALTEVAVRIVPGAEQAGITTESRGRMRTHGATGKLVDAVDAIQYELNSGPCVQAVGGESVVSSPDVGTDKRFPAFGPRAVAETHVRSILSLHLPHGDETADGLNLYATELAAFDDEAQSIAIALASQGALAVAAVRARAQAAQLSAALENSRDIGIAMGVLMRSHTITRDSAFEMLRDASQSTHRKLADIARDVADTGTLDVGPQASS